MGLAMSVPQLLIILVIVGLIFGTKRLKEVGGDLGNAVKSFRKAMNTSAERRGRSLRIAEAADPRRRKAVVSVLSRPARERWCPFL